MSETRRDYGLLITPNIKIQRKYFKEMTKLHGINCVYWAPRVGKDFDPHGDLATNYFPPKEGVGCIFQEHPDQKTLKKMGWVAELQDGASIIHVPYDLEGLEQGALFDVPSGLDNAPSRRFRVISMQNIMVYPASIACEIALEWEDIDESNKFNDFRKEDITLLLDNEEDD